MEVRKITESDDKKNIWITLGNDSDYIVIHLTLNNGKLEFWEKSKNTLHLTIR